MNEGKRNALVRLSGAAIAVAAAGMFVTASVGTAVAAEKDVVHCAGINSCKGKSDCKGAKNDCKGQNSCKGQGWKETKAQECKDKGGTIEKS